MKVVGLVGESGSGKSHRAIWVAHENGIKFIIDDGLLISENRIIAGKSAKREKTKIASIRRAIFTDPLHIQEVKREIERLKPASILILGTSNEMIQVIARALALPEATKFIHITDIATPAEIKKAKATRESLGKHVIPVPTFELKKDFSGYFMDSLKVILGFNRKDNPFVAHKTVVRPTFSYLGDYVLSKKVITDICRHETAKCSGVTEVAGISVIDTLDGVRVDIDVSLRFGSNIKATCHSIQQNVKTALGDYAALAVTAINIKIITLT